MISLFDRQYQHIIAEATPTSSLFPTTRSLEPGDQGLWLCGTAIPRSFGICEQLLTQPNPDGTSPRHEIPITVIGDLIEHPTHSKKPYCRQWPHHRFYAGVPIRSNRGINIGVLCVFDTQPRSTLDESAIGLLQDLSAAILTHLELRKYGDGRHSGERMARGLGSYVEGKATMSGWQYKPGRDFNERDSAQEGFFNQNQQILQHQRDELVTSEIAREQATEPDAAHPPTPNIDALSFPLLSPYIQVDSTLAGPASREELEALHLQDIFSRAANVIRESIEVEGVVFLDPSIGPHAGSANSGPTQGAPSAAHQYNTSSSSEDGEKSASSSRSVLEEEVMQANCSVLGFSTSLTSSIDGASPTPDQLVIPARFLQKLLGRYPKGKIFNFDDRGVICSSEPSSGETTAGDDAAGQKGGSIQNHKTHRKLKHPFSRQNEGKTINDLFPGARSVCLFPLWDQQRQRWFAGGFAYTMTPTRILTVQGELSFLSAFGTVIMSDVEQLKASLVRTATTDLLSSLSHELRSPLHGMVLAAELLRDTHLNVFQSDVLGSLETCGRTLLDTINHLLYWAKINNFINSPKDRDSSNKPKRRGLGSGRTNSITDGMMHIASGADLDILVEEVVDCVYAGHVFQQQSEQRFHRRASYQGPNNDPLSLLDSMDAAESPRPERAGGQGLQLSHESVNVLIDIDPATNWVFRTQPGALRRVIMNLCGNSLRYTTHGFVKVAISQEAATPAQPEEYRIIRITVTDTGSGIGEDYLRHHIFTPFAQENTLAAGAGLGLSLVKQIVKALDGSIRVQSKVGRGTKMTVKLPMQIPSSPLLEPISGGDYHTAAVTELSDLRVSLVGFPGAPNPLHGQVWESPEFDENALLEKICQDQLRLRVVKPHEKEELLSDLILCNERQLGTILNQQRTDKSPPVIVVCSSASAARQLEKTHISTVGRGNRGLFSYISRPLGPRKLAKALLVCFKRWIKTQAELADSISTTTDEVASKVEIEATGGSTGKRPDGYFDVPTRLGYDGYGTPMPPSTSAGASPRPLNRRFLLVEDNPINMRLLESYMKKLGQAHDSVADGQQAVDAYKGARGQFQCILMDISMPVMDGFEATRQIRMLEKDHQIARCPILALSGLASKNAQEEAFTAGIDLFLSKPVKLKELSQVLESRKII
ncbi:hypothetical protein ACJ41O_003958 [Fusarium nematophilum]